MFFPKTVVCLMFLINDSTQFLVANCVWDDALSGVPVGNLKGFVLSDADACALFCSKTGGVVTASTDTQSATSRPDAALCDRCCKSSQPPSKPGELLVSILQTLIKAFGPTETTTTQAVSPVLGAGGSGAPPASKPLPPPPAPAPSPAPSPEQPPTQQPDGDDDDDDGPMFDDGGAGVPIENFRRGGKTAQYIYPNTNNHGFESDGYSGAEPRQIRADPEARIFEITGRDDGTAHADGFERGADRGPNWPHPGPGANFALKSGTIR